MIQYYPPLDSNAEINAESALNNTYAKINNAESVLNHANAPTDNANAPTDNADTPTDHIAEPRKKVTRADILGCALDAVMGEREQQYGNP